MAREKRLDRRPLAALLVLVQWPLAAALLPVLRRRHAFASEVLGVALVALGAALWLFLRSRSGRSRGHLPGAVLMTLGSYLCFRHESFLAFCLAAAAFWILASLSLVRQGSRSAGRAALAVGAVFLALFAAEPVAEWREASGGPPGAEGPRMGGGGLEGQVEIPDREATGQLLPMGRARAWKKRADGGAEFDVVYRIDRFGSRRVPARPEEGPSWMLFGGSFTFGEGLEDEETIANRLQLRMPGARLYNFGVRSSGPADVLLTLRRKLGAGERPAGVLYFFIEDHIRRTALPARTVAEKGFRPRFRLMDGEPVFLGKADRTIQGRIEAAHVNLVKRSALYRRLAGDWEPTEASLDLVAALAGAIRGEAESAGSRFLFVFLPQREARWPERAAGLRERLDARGIATLDCQALMALHLRASGEPESAYYFGDGHPNAAYAELVAPWIAAHLGELGWIGPESTGSASP